VIADESRAKARNYSKASRAEKIRIVGQHPQTLKKCLLVRLVGFITKRATTG
jgi:hypothetical protein